MLSWVGLCRAATSCCFYTPLRAIEADVLNAPDIVDLNVEYPVEFSAGMGKRSGECAGCCGRGQRDVAEDTLDLGKSVAN